MTELDRWLDRVHCGDCLDVLRELPDCSVDLCATDPPYALTSGTGAKGGFMGKAWDAALPARAIWAEVLRVLKPGASCFVCAGARQDTLLGMLTDLREVGFDIQHSALSWVYATGFPKARRLSIDSASLVPEDVRCRCAGTTSSTDHTVPFARLADHMHTDLLVRVADAAEAGDLQQVAALARSYTGMHSTVRTDLPWSLDDRTRTLRVAASDVSASEVPSALSAMSEPPGSLADCLPDHHSGDALLPLLQAACRALLRLQGYAPAHTRSPEPVDDPVGEPSRSPSQAQRTDLRANTDCFPRVGLQRAWQGLQECAGVRFPSASLSSYASNKDPSSPRESGAASDRSACRSERTPCSVFDLSLESLLFVSSWEAIHIVPYAGVCVKCGGVRIDDSVATGSVPLKPMTEHILWVTKPAEPGPARNNVLKWGVGAVNVAECRVPVPAADHSALHGSTRGPVSGKGYVGNFGLQCNYEPVEYNPSGRYPSNLLVSARALGDDSKYGDLDAWSQARGLSEEWLDAALSAGVLRVPKPSRSEKNAGCEGVGFEGKGRWNKGGEFQEVVRERGNNHATVKPVTLMAFLCTLACPRGGVVLDPFLGSGTTAVAATQSGMHYIGIEREPEYVAIAEARIAAAIRDHQPTLAI